MRYAVPPVWFRSLTQRSLAYINAVYSDMEKNSVFDLGYGTACLDMPSVVSWAGTLVWTCSELGLYSGPDALGASPLKLYFLDLLVPGPLKVYVGLLVLVPRPLKVYFLDLLVSINTYYCRQLTAIPRDAYGWRSGFIVF